MIFTKEECEKWKKNPGINPRNNRKLKTDAKKGVYSNLVKDCGLLLKDMDANVDDTKPKVTNKESKDTNAVFTKEECKTWKKNPGINPRNNRKLKTDAKKGIYNQLVAICDILLKEDNDDKHDKEKEKNKPEQKSPNTQDNLEADRLRLIRAVRKAIKPILHKIDTTEMRIKYSEIINNYIKSLQPCLQQVEINGNQKLVLTDAASQPIVTFDKRIGSESVYGVAYLNTGKKFAKLLKFSCKVMQVTAANTREVAILKNMTKMVQNGISPNMPMTYKVLKCNLNCDMPLCPDMTKYSTTGYYVVINELANYDIQNWFKEVHTNEQYTSVIMQILFAIQAFHNMNHTHNDTHLGNFLVHKIKPGGYWHYKMKETDIYIPNCGYLLVLWDPGLARKFTKITEKVLNEQIKDFYKPIFLINSINIKDHYGYIKRGLKPIPQLIQNITAHLAKLTYNLRYTPEFYDTFNDMFKNNELNLPGVVVNAAPKEIINSKPYILCKK